MTIHTSRVAHFIAITDHTRCILATAMANLPNISFQRTRVRGGRGPGPLNSKR